MTDRTFIAGWAAHHPANRLTNDDLVARMDTTHEWLESHLGITERRIADADHGIADLGEICSLQAMERAGVTPTQLDYIIGTTSSDDMVVPSAAARIGARIDAPDAHAFDVRAACAGWFTGLQVADAFLRTAQADRLLICAGEVTRFCVDPQDRLGAIYFGDAAAAGVVQRERPARGLELVDMVRLSDNSLHDLVECPTNGYFRTDARGTRRWVEHAAADVSERILKRHDLTADDLAALVCHQANLRLVEHLAASIGVPEERHWHNVEWSGNTASAGAPSALFEGIDLHEDELVDGAPILVVTVGSGLTAMGVLLRWVASDPA